MKFEGIQFYVVIDDFKFVVNVVIILQWLLLVKGELGIGKIMFVEQLVEFFGVKLIIWYIKFIIKVYQGFYEYDVVSCLCDLQLGVDKVYDVCNYIKKGKFWEVFEVQERVILLIDEIDKVDIEFFNDLLQEFDKMEFYVYEINEIIKVKQCLIIIIILNNEKELFDVFLCCCFFYYIVFFDCEMLQKIVDVYYLNIKQLLVSEVLDIFFDVCKVFGLKKKFLIFELVDWLKLLMVDEIGEVVLCECDLIKVILLLVGVLVKNEQDVQFFECLVFMSCCVSC